MSKMTTQDVAEHKKSQLQIHLLDFDRKFAEWLEESVQEVRFRSWACRSVASSHRFSFENSLFLVELKKPAERESDSCYADLIRLFTRQLSGTAPVFVASWLDQTKAKDHLLADLFENIGATLVCGRAYRAQLVNILLSLSNRDPSSVLTNVNISDEGLDVAFGDRKHAKVALPDIKRLVEKTDIVWNRIRIPPSRDHLLVGIAGGEDVPVPSDILREYVVEDQLKQRKEYRGLTSTTARVLGERLRYLREAKRMTQEDLASKAQVSRWTIIRLEKGRLLPRIRALEKIVQALGTNLVSFLPS